VQRVRTRASDPAGPADPARRPADRRWLVLAVLGTAQLMVVLDNTIVNVALPSAQADLGFGSADRVWVVTAYALAFGCLLLLGGRLSDLLGRRRAFLIGLVGFAAASAAGGAATGLGTLVTARIVQGVFAALLAPTVLSLISETFPSGRERARAFGVVSAVVGSGAATGLVLGGVLTEFLSWRWTLYVNVVVGSVVLAAALWLLPRRTGGGSRTPIDVPGALLVVGALSGIVLGLARAGTAGWAAPTVIVPLVAGVLLLGGFVLRQHLARHPLLPLTVLRDRRRAGAYLSRFVASVANFAVVFFMTFFLQDQLGLSPLWAGAAIVPMILGIVTGSNLAGVLLIERLGARGVTSLGLAVSGAALAVLALIDTGTGYATGLLPALIVFGVGQGMTSSTSMSSATRDLPADQVGVASATTNVMQQLGGSLGTAALSTVAATVAVAAGGGAEATVQGYAAAFTVASGLSLVTALVCLLVIPPGRRPAPEPRP